MLSLHAALDGAGDGWIDVSSHALEPLVGMRLNLVACETADAAAARSLAGSSCATVAVFGGAEGAAERAGWFLAAGHAMSHGVFGFCLAGPCRVVAPVASSAAPLLLTRLSVVIPLVGNSTVVCTSPGDVLFTAMGAADASGEAGAPRQVAVPPTCSRPLSLGSSPGDAAGVGLRRGVAFVKTYKTGSSTIASLLQRRADIRSLDVSSMRIPISRRPCAPPHNHRHQFPA